MKSGWCMQPLKAKKQHEICKHVFTGSGSSAGKWTCACTCHGEVQEEAVPKGRAEKTKGK